MIGGTNTVGIVLDKLYPVGSVYIGTMSACPLADLIAGSTWESVGSGRVLQGADSSHAAATTVEAGLPNITGEFSGRCLINNSTSTSGAFYEGSSFSTQYAGGSDGTHTRTFAFDASRSSSVYGNSSTVQPAAYVVNIWRRTA